MDENKDKTNEGRSMENFKAVKGSIIALFAGITSALGALFIPLISMLCANLIDYITGILCAKYRGQVIDSSVGRKGIIKKVSMWLVVIVGAIVDVLIKYSANTFGISLPFTFLFSCATALWITCNELLSILENVNDMGVPLPKFLQKIVVHIKNQVETKADVEEDATKKSDVE